jgi:hypothetical protein
MVRKLRGILLATVLFGAAAPDAFGGLISVVDSAPSGADSLSWFEAYSSPSQADFVSAQGSHVGAYFRAGGAIGLPLNGPDDNLHLNFPGSQVDGLGFPYGDFILRTRGYTLLNLFYGNSVVIVFDTPVSFFGFQAYPTQNVEYVIYLYGESQVMGLDNPLAAPAILDLPNGFLGIRDTEAEIKRILIEEYTSNNMFYMNTLYFSSDVPVPEPASLIFIGSGVFAFGLCAVRRVSRV